MSQSMLKRYYKILGENGQSFTDFVVAQIELCREKLDEALHVAAKDHRGRPVLYCILRHVSRSGMSRTISLHYIDLQSGDLKQLNYVSAVLVGLAYDEERDGVKIRGCGMDMGYEIVSILARLDCGDENALKHHWV